jgi:hypothetical protein
MTRVTCTESALIEACRLHPEEDTPRLMYADWLDENAGLVACGDCAGRGFVKKYLDVIGADKFVVPDDFGYEGVPLKKVACPHCSGSCTVTDDKAAKAELIRVQVALAKIQPRKCHLHCKAEGPPGPVWCTNCCHDPKCCNCDLAEERWPLTQQQNALIDAHPHWRPVCPVCEGEKLVCEKQNGGWACVDCSGDGHIGTFTRGFIEELPVQWEWVAQCPDCTEGRWRNGSDGVCRTCDADLRTQPIPYEPTEWAKSVVASHPLVRLSLIGKEPHEWANSGSGIWHWYHSRQTINDPTSIPTMIYKRLKSRTFDSAELAIAAQSEALVDWIRNPQPEG